MTHHGDSVEVMEPEAVLALRKRFKEEYRNNFDAIDFHGRPSTAYVAWLEQQVLRHDNPQANHECPMCGNC